MFIYLFSFLNYPKGLQVVCETTQPEPVPAKASVSACHPGNSLDGSVSSQTSQERSSAHPRYKDLQEKLGLTDSVVSTLSGRAEGVGCLYQILNSICLTLG